MNRIGVFGIDGGTLDLVRKWEGELPTLKKIMDGGISGELKSTVPAITCPAWASMFTGLSPGKLNMYDFVNKAGHIFNLNDYYDKTIWKTLSSCGRTVGLLNVPLTYPPREINGYMVSGLGTPDTLSIRYTYPQHLQDILSEYKYVVSPNVLLTLYGQEQKCLEAVMDALEKRIQIAYFLLEHYPVDLFVCVFFCTDIVQHYFWRFIDRDHPRYEPIYQDVIKNVYKRIDEAIGNMMCRFSDVVVVSDHGFASCYGNFAINRWLEREGYLKYKARHSDSSLVYNARDFVLSHVNSKTAGFLARLLPGMVANKLRTSGESLSRMAKFCSSVDWDGTRAYALNMATGGIFADASVEGEIKAKLEILGFNVIQANYGEDAPNLFIELGSSKYYPRAFGCDVFNATSLSGSHKVQGLFMACGEKIKNDGVVLRNLNICDIAPTLLRMFGLSGIEGMDGRVLREILR